MHHLHFCKRPSLILLALTAIISATISLSDSRAADADVIRVEAGQTIEIGTDTTSPNAQFSWILTKDRQFIGAQRTRFFQTRLAEAGTYTLDVSIQNPTSSESDYRAFTLLVSAPTGANNPSPSIDTGNDTFTAVLRTDPAIINGTVYLPPEGGIIMLDPSQSKGSIASYSFDLDSTVDTDSDGNPFNDLDNQGTISERQGTILFLFMLPKAGNRTVSLTVTDLSSGRTANTSVGIAFSAPPAGQQQPAVNQTVQGPIGMEIDGLSVTFTSRLDPALTQGKQLLSEWDFGDHLKSLLDTPRHTYSAPGTYTVALTVRDITNGSIVYSGTASIDVSAPLAPPSSTASQPTSSAPSATESSSSSSASTGTTTSKLPIGSILTVGFILLIILAFAVGLFFVFQWLKGKTTASLQKTLEKMEGSIVGKESKAPSAATPEPLKLKKEAPKATLPPLDIADREKGKSEFTSRTRTNETPVSTSGPVPAWLANAGAKSTPTTPAPAVTTPAKPAFAPATNGNTAPAAPSWLTQTPASSPAPAPRSAPVPPAANQAAVTPPWLAKAQSMTAAPSVSQSATPSTPVTAIKPPSPAPAPAPTLEPAPAPKPMATPPPVTPAPAPAPAQTATKPLASLAANPPPAPSKAPEQAMTVPKPQAVIAPTTPAPVAPITQSAPVQPNIPAPTPIKPSPTPAKTQDEKSAAPPSPPVPAQPKPQSVAPTPSPAPTPPAPTQQSKPVVKEIAPADDILPTSAPMPIAKKAEDAEPPIAIIQADSLNKK